MPNGYGFVKIGEVNGINTTSFVDDNNGNGLDEGMNYCYRVIAVFDDGAESIVSDEICAEFLNKSPL